MTNDELDKYDKWLKRVFAVGKPLPKLTEHERDDGWLEYRDPNGKVRALVGPSGRKQIRQMFNVHDKVP